MITEKDLRELLDYKSESPLLSLYLNTEPIEGGAETHRRHLRSMLKDVDLPEDVQVVERYFDHEFDWSGRSVVVFSCAEKDYLRTYTLQVPIDSRVRIDNRPHVKPLVDAQDSFGGYGVALVDKQGARLFHFHLGELSEQEGILGESIRRTKRGGGSAAQGRRGGAAGQTNHVEEVAERNIKEAADFAAQFFAENKVRRILLGGTDDNLALFRANLPKAWQSLVVGTFPMSMTASHNDIYERAMQIGLEAERKREAKLVDAVVTNAAKGKGGVVRLDDTLGAVHEGRVQVLVVQEGFRASGQRCTGCGYMSTQQIDKCVFCGGEFERIPDAVELAVRKVIQSGGEVEFIHENRKLENYGKVGALLRY